MADVKITALTVLTAADPINDAIPIVDVSNPIMAASGTTSRISINNLLSSSPTATGALTVTGLVTAGSATITGAATVGTTLGVTGVSTFAAGTALLPALTTTGDTNTGIYYPAADTFAVTTGGTERYRVDSAGNLGIGVTPSAWRTSVPFKALQIGYTGTVYALGATEQVNLSSNYLQDTAGNEVRIQDGYATRYQQASGQHLWSTVGTSTAGSGIAFGDAKMTLDASGNLLVGDTTGSNSRFIKAVTAGTTVLEVTGAAGYGSFFQSGDAQGSSSALSIANIGKVVSTGRSINAGGTVNASGADYAEYMVKCSDFILSKGDVAGIDANGKLTNVFADAISFVVKSTDPSYVGNDKWGVDLEGDALEAARQLVDRIAFAGQVPVNVTGAKAGDYIVPVVDGTGIKGISVSKPTFEQYQLAVGKVIAIDTDGRARIIVKVA